MNYQKRQYLVSKRDPSTKYHILGPVRHDGTIPMGYGGQLCLYIRRREDMVDPPLFNVGDMVYDGITPEPQRINEIQWDEDGQSWLCWLKHSVVLERRLRYTPDIQERHEL